MESLSMIIELVAGAWRIRHSLALALLIVVGHSPSILQAAEPVPFNFLYVGFQDDPDYRPHRAYTGLVLRDRKPPKAGAETAMRESRIIGRSVGVRFSLHELTIDGAADIVSAIRRSAQEHRAGVVLLDLPIGPFREVVAGLGRGDDLMLFNIRHSDNELRGIDCAPALFHTLPSAAMLTDALAQYLRSRKWTRILLLAGETESDSAFADSFDLSARKFGLRILARRSFILSNDPREREQNNIRLLTGSPDYDVIFLADNQGEFGRYVPFASLLPRPVVGMEGLVPSAWHWTWERHGAPQLNQRFDRRAKRQMAPEDWAAWAAVRSVVEAVVRSGETDIAAIRNTLVSDDFTFDTYKGVPANFRPWNNQLRQPVLLHTHNAVIARAPVEGFLHKDNVLDSLGIDQRQSPCVMR
jgi:ABC transporter substrate binding protein (PQQ-dependent alcohol dehydrogenase system)